MTDVLLIRHADAVGAGKGYFGRTETPLSPLGREQAARLGPVLAVFAPDEIWVSPSSRARATAELALAALPQAVWPPAASRVERGRPRPPQRQGPGADGTSAIHPSRLSQAASREPQAASREPIIQPDLREIDFGRWEGKTFAEIAAEDPGRIDDWAALKPDFAFPGGESLRDFEARIHRVADRIRAASCARLAVVTHGGIIRYVLADLLRLGAGRVWVFALPPGSVTSLHLQDGYAQLTGLRRNEDLRGSVAPGH